MNRITPPQVPAFAPFFRSVLTILCLSSALARAQSPGASHSITTIASTVPCNGDVNPYGNPANRERLGHPRYEEREQGGGSPAGRPVPKRRNRSSHRPTFWAQISNKHLRS